MTDIVQRLRDAKRIAPGWKSLEPNPLCQEAADEIERLRAELSAASQQHSAQGE